MAGPLSPEVLVTAEEAYPVFERCLLAARREVLMGFRVFEARDPAGDAGSPQGRRDLGRADRRRAVARRRGRPDALGLRPGHPPGHASPDLAFLRGFAEGCRGEPPPRTLHRPGRHASGPGRPLAAAGALAADRARDQPPTRAPERTQPRGTASRDRADAAARAIGHRAGRPAGREVVAGAGRCRRSPITRSSRCSTRRCFISAGSTSTSGGATARRTTCRPRRPGTTSRCSCAARLRAPPPRISGASAGSRAAPSRRRRRGCCARYRNGARSGSRSRARSSA